jgi:hypothetical protein
MPGKKRNGIWSQSDQSTHPDCVIFFGMLTFLTLSAMSTLRRFPISMFQSLPEQLPHIVRIFGQVINDISESGTGA